MRYNNGMTASVNTLPVDMNLDEWCRKYSLYKLREDVTITFGSSMECPEKNGKYNNK